MLKKIQTVLRHPHIAREFAVWTLKKMVLGQEPQKTVRNNILVGDFARFSEYLAVDNYLNDDEYTFFTNLKMESGAIIDIGANRGVLSIMFAKMHPKRTVYAIEPNPPTFKMLRSNTLLNSTSNVKCYDVALSDEKGTVSFFTRLQSRDMASIAYNDSEQTISVECTTLDNFVSQENIKGIALIKIDVEGFEERVFRGGERTLLNLKPKYIYFEVCPPIAKRAGFAPDGPAKMLQGAGYDLFRLRPDGSLAPATLSEIAALSYENWVAIHG